MLVCRRRSARGGPPSYALLEVVPASAVRAGAVGEAVSMETPLVCDRFAGDNSAPVVLDLVTPLAAPPDCGEAVSATSESWVSSCMRGRVPAVDGLSFVGVVWITLIELRLRLCFFPSSLCPPLPSMLPNRLTNPLLVCPEGDIGAVYDVGASSTGEAAVTVTGTASEKGAEADGDTCIECRWEGGLEA